MSKTSRFLQHSDSTTFHTETNLPHKTDHIHRVGHYPHPMRPLLQNLKLGARWTMAEDHQTDRDRHSKGDYIKTGQPLEVGIRPNNGRISTATQLRRLYGLTQAKSG